MEKCYKIPKDSKLAQDFEAYQKNREETRTLLMEHLEKFGFKPESFWAGNIDIFIKLTAADDRTRFAQKTDSYGLHRFKVNDAVVVEWRKLLKDKQFKVIPYFNPSWYLLEGSGAGSQVFEHPNGFMYGRFFFDSDNRRIEAPEEFEAIKTSEFYRLYEEYQGGQSAE